MTQVLFICKGRSVYNDQEGYSTTLSSGLYNSARLVSDMLNQNGISSAIENAIDNNCIDKFLTLHRPKYCIIEAIWVVPNKFEILTKLHPNVLFIVRNHSNLPFLATEGIAVDWLCQYVTYTNVYIACNTKECQEEFKNIVDGKFGSEKVGKVLYFPNYYVEPPKASKPLNEYNGFNIGCFRCDKTFKESVVTRCRRHRIFIIFKKISLFSC